jgi:hypothetical protein
MTKTTATEGEEKPGDELITRAEAEAIAERKIVEYQDWLLPRINEGLGQLEDKIGFLYSKVRKATWPCLEKP